MDYIDPKTLQAARTAHEVNRVYCSMIGDDTAVAWDEAPDWQKRSAVDGVTNILLNEGMTPEKSHEGWLAHKQSEGWVYGPLKDPVKKEHPCMVPYDQLPQEQRMKDHLFLAVVNSFKK